LASHSIEEHIVRELIKDNSETVRVYLSKLKQEQIISLFDDFLDKKDKLDVKIPISILGNRKLSCLESVIKFLREEVDLSNSQVSKILARSPQTCWTTYRNAVKKLPARSKFDFSENDIPVSVIRNNKLSVLESIVVFLAGKYLSFHEIALLLNRDDRTIWTVHKRAMTKNEH